MNFAKRSPDGIHPTIVAVVVTYQPEPNVLNHIERIYHQIKNIVVVDNASGNAYASTIDLAAKMPGVWLIRNSSNLGIAAALNVGIQLGLQLGANWIATFDQDTGIPEAYFEQLLETYESCPQSKIVGMIVPAGWVGIGAPRRSTSTESRGWSFVRGAVNSGSLIKSEIIRKTGLYEEDLFIDYVDTEFCLRLQKYGFKILSVSSVFLEHELGEKQTCRILGWPLSFRIHKAWRYYYNVRNRLLLYRRYAWFSPMWFQHDARWLIMELCRIIILEHGRKEKILAVLYGIKDGLCGRSGRNPKFPRAISESTPL